MKKREGKRTEVKGREKEKRDEKIKKQKKGRTILWRKKATKYCSRGSIDEKNERRKST